MTAETAPMAPKRVAGRRAILVLLLALAGCVVVPAPPPPTTTTTTTPPKTFPDVVITSLSMTPLNPRVGQEVTFSAVVKNNGTGPTPPGTTIGVAFHITQCGGTDMVLIVPPPDCDLGNGVATNVNLVSWSDYDSTSLRPGEAITLFANWGPLKKATWTAWGTRYELGLSFILTGWVDNINRFPEVNETNNQDSLIFATSCGSICGPLP